MELLWEYVAATGGPAVGTGKSKEILHPERITCTLVIHLPSRCKYAIPVMKVCFTRARHSSIPERYITGMPVRLKVYNQP